VRKSLGINSDVFGYQLFADFQLCKSYSLGIFKIVSASRELLPASVCRQLNAAIPSIGFAFGAFVENNPFAQVM